MSRLNKYWQDHPAVRLTVAYVAILMFLSTIFSAALYRLASDQLTRGLRSQYVRLHPYFIQGINPGGPISFTFNDELDRAHAALVLELVYFNLLILVGGSIICYWLARQTLRPIEESLEAQSQFTADASHELRTPLAAMQTEIEVALRDPTLNLKAAKSQLKSNLEEVAKLKHLSDSLLSLAKGEELGQSHIIDLVEVLESALARAQKQAADNKIKLDQSLPNRLRLSGNQRSLEDLFVNLLDNAIKYSPPGTKVALKAQSKSGQARVEVSDQGPGIAPEDQPRIWQRFWRVDQARTKGGSDGYGLGLAIAKRVVAQHGGTISIKSQRGQGSTFIVQLPLDEVV